MCVGCVSVFQFDCKTSNRSLIPFSLVHEIQSIKITLTWDLYWTHCTDCDNLLVCLCFSRGQGGQTTHSVLYPCFMVCLCAQDLVVSESKRNQLRGNSKQVKHDAFK